jgi:hypothetical protein
MIELNPKREASRRNGPMDVLKGIRNVNAGRARQHSHGMYGPPPVEHEDIVMTHIPSLTGQPEDPLQVIRLGR